jgi:hypothetical protein
MATISKKIYYSGLHYVKIPGISGDVKFVQADVHGGGGGGTVPTGLLTGGTGGFGAYVAGMFGVPGGSELHIGVAGGGGSGQVAEDVENGGIVSGWQVDRSSPTSSGGRGGRGNTSDNSVQGGGGGALSSVVMTFPNALYTQNHLDNWPTSPNVATPVLNYTITPLIWAGGGGGGPGANIRRNGVVGSPGQSAYTNYLHGIAWRYSNQLGNNGDIHTKPQQGSQLRGDYYGGGGTGAAADSYYGEYNFFGYNNQYSAAYFRNGGGGAYYYEQVSAYGGRPGKSGINGYFTSTQTWYEVPEIYPGGAWSGTSRALSTANVPNGNTSIIWLSSNTGMGTTKNVLMGPSQYGLAGDVGTPGGDGRVTIRYEDVEGTPNEIDTFLTDYDVEIDTRYTTRNSVTVFGINVPVPATVIGDDAKLVVNGTVIQVGKTVQITNGTILQLNVLSPPTFNTTKTTILRVGTEGAQVESRYVMITKSTPPALANPWDFTDVNNALPNQLVSSDTVQITGIATQSTSVSISASTISGIPIASQDLSLFINNIKRETNTGIIENGQTLQVKVKSSATPGDKVTVLITIGDAGPVDWVVTTTDTIDTSPEFYNFTNIADVIGGAEVESNVVQITGINYSATVTTSNDNNIPVFVSVNGGAWKNPSAEVVTIENNQSLQLKITPPNLPNTTVKSTVVVGTNQYGSLSDEWKVTTSIAGDTVPDPFLFVDRQNQKATTLVYSNQIIVRGITAPAPLTITKPTGFTGSQAQFSVNNGTDWYDITGQTHPSSPAPQFISNNSPLMLRLRTGGYGSNSAIINVDIGGVNDQWAVTPLPEVPVSDQLSTWYSSLGKADGYSIGTVISVFRDSFGTFGVLDGSPESRYPGFIECDGRTLNVSDYPDLFDVIGNTYGGTGNKSDDSPYVYSGDFKIPDYRNRKLYGTGRVDGNVSSSVSVPTFIGPDGTDTGSSITVGSQGGFWYIDKIDTKGPYPREQLFEDEISGEFFRLGTIRTSGYPNVTGTMLFNIIGDCNAEIGPLRETMVKTPEHFHELVSSSVSETANGLIAWGSPGILALEGSRRLGQSGVGTYYPGAPSPPRQNLFSNEWRGSVSYNNYWASPVDNNIPLNNSNNSDAPGRVTTGGSVRLGALDMGGNTTANVIGYSPGGTLNHNHYISNIPFGANVYGYGNVNGPGTEYGSNTLLETANVSFSSSEVALISDIATFTLSTKKAIIPTAKFKPNVTVPLISKYYRAKYIIKAF